MRLTFITLPMRFAERGRYTERARWASPKSFLGAFWMFAVEVFTERVKPLPKEDREFVAPLHDVPQWFGLQAVQPVAAFAAHSDEFGVFKDPKML